MEQRKRTEALFILLKASIVGLAAKVDAPPFPSPDAEFDEVRAWVLDVLKRVGDRLPKTAPKLPSRHAINNGWFYWECDGCGIDCGEKIVEGRPFKCGKCGLEVLGE
jgi:hypothetical protein